jgi:hypothetical protein
MGSPHQADTLRRRTAGVHLAAYSCDATATSARSAAHPGIRRPRWFCSAGKKASGSRRRDARKRERLARKTLFDALSLPPNAQQVPNNPDVESDKRIFYLLEDDKLVTSVTVSNDRLLSLPDGSNDVLVVLRAHPLAFRATFANVALAV